MKNKLIFILVIIFLVLAAVAFIYIYNAPIQSGGDADQKLIANLKEFNSMTTYENVISVLGEPARISGMTREWKVDSGNIKIVFQRIRPDSLLTVMRVEYINGLGEKVYWYKLLKD